MNHELLKLADEATAALDLDTPAEKVLAAIELRAALKEAVRALDAAMEPKLVAWLEANGQLECGTKRYYAGVRKDTKCVDQGATLTTLLETASVETIAECLASGAFKPGKCREVLPPEEYARLFETKETGELREGKPVKRLQTVDERFLK